MSTKMITNSVKIAANHQILVCIWIVTSSHESSKITMKVKSDARPSDVIAESIRHKMRKMNVTPEQQQKSVATYLASYILKVCGCEEFMLGDYPINQYKVRLFCNLIFSGV